LKWINPMIISSSKSLIHLCLINKMNIYFKNLYTQKLISFGKLKFKNLSCPNLIKKTHRSSKSYYQQKMICKNNKIILIQIIHQPILILNRKARIHNKFLNSRKSKCKIFLVINLMFNNCKITIKSKILFYHILIKLLHNNNNNHL